MYQRTFSQPKEENCVHLRVFTSFNPPSFVHPYVHSITGSAVCAFYMDDIEKSFNGKFKEQRNSESAWTPVPDEQVPNPR